MFSFNLKNNISKYKKLYRVKSKGFTLLFAVLVTVVVLSVSISMISVSIKQNKLSSVGKDSLYAFYAANSALECAMYWDYHSPTAGLPVFPNIQYLDEQFLDAGHDSVRCSGMSIITKDGAPDIPFLAGDTFIEPNENLMPGELGPGEVAREYTTFKLVIYPDSDITGDLRMNTDEVRMLCAEVSVRKFDVDPDSFLYTTRVEVQGYSSCDIDNPRTVQRGLVIEYER